MFSNIWELEGSIYQRLLYYCLHTMQLTVYCSYLGELLRYTSEEHVDYQPIGSAIQDLKELSQVTTENVAFFTSPAIYGC